jgi:hypothetical protein
MPTYIVELEDGRELEVEADTPPTSEDLTQYFAAQNAPQDQEAKKDLPFGDITDVASALGQAGKSVFTTVPASFRQMYEGSMNPWNKSSESLQSRKEMQRVAQESEAAQAEAEASGDASVMGRAIRSGIPSYGFTGAILPVSVAAGGVAGLGTGLVSKNPVAAQRAAIAAGSAASGIAAYRMASSQFMDDARERIDNFFLEKTGRLPNKQEQDEAYQELLPLAQEMGMAEALPEAFGNLALAGAGKYIYRILGGKTGVQQLASGALSKVRGLNAAKALGAGAASTGVEVGTEGVTEMLNEDTMKKLEEGVMRGEDVSTVQTEPYSMKRLGESIEKVAEPTLATTALMGLLGAGGGMAYRAATKQNLSESDFRSKMEKQLRASQIGLANPETTATNKSIYGEKAEEAAAALKALDEGRTSDVEKFFNVRFKPTDPGLVAAENLVAATVDNPDAQDAAATATDIIAQNEAFADSMPPPPSEPAVQSVEEVEEAGPEVTPEMPVLEEIPVEETPSLPETGPPVVDQEAPAVTTVQAAPIQPTAPQENAPLEIIDTKSLRQEPQDRVESREAEETGVSRGLLSPAAGEEEVVAPTRDVTKPEQMTREEYSASNTATLNKVAALRDEMFKKQRQEYEAERTKLQKKRAAALKRISRLNLNGSTEEIDPNTDSASKRIIEGLQKDIKKIDETLFTLMPPIQTKVFDEAAKELGYDKKETHRGVVHDALVTRKPVNAAAADAYGYTNLPEGYVKQGDLYVFQPKEFTSGGKQPLQTGSGTGTTRQLQAGKERGETKALESEGISVTAGEYITEDEARAGFQIAVGTLDKGSVAPDSPAILISEKLSKDSDAVKAIYGFPNSVRGVLIQIHLGLPVSIEGDNTQRAFKIASEAPKFFPLAKNYTRQGDLYIFQPGATGEPVQVAPSAAQAVKATAPGPVSKNRIIKHWVNKAVPGKPGKYTSEAETIDYDALPIPSQPLWIKGNDITQLFPKVNEAANMAASVDQAFQEAMAFGGKGAERKSLPGQPGELQILVGEKPKSRKAKSPSFTSALVKKVNIGDTIQAPISDYSNRSIVIEDEDGNMRALGMGSRSGSGGMVALGDINNHPLLWGKPIPEGALRVYTFDWDSVNGNLIHIYDVNPSPQTTTVATQNETAAPLAEGAAVAGASSSLTGGRSSELPPRETQETQPSTGEIPVPERDADSIIGALDVMRNQFRDQAKVKRTLDDEVGRLPKAKLKEVADALGVKATKEEVVASIMSEPTRTEKVMADIYGKEEEEAEQRESFKEERRRARDSITAKDKPLDERPEVTRQDVKFAQQMVQKEVPASALATVTTAEEFLANAALTKAFPDIADGLRAGRIEGVFISSGHVFLFPENIIARQSDIKAAEELGIPVSVAAARRVILHESLVHFGFAGLTENEQNWLIDWAKRNSTEADIADVLRKYPRESNEDQATHMLRAFEERLAAIIEKTGKWPESSAWQELKAFLRRLWNRIMGVADAKPTDKELLNVLRMLQSGSERMLEKSFAKTGLGGNVRLAGGRFFRGSIPLPMGSRIMPDGAALIPPQSNQSFKASINAYHGTPHKVDKFTTTKIGTGEGAQAYGWGLYFAQTADVAKNYKASNKKASGRQQDVRWTINGEKYTPTSDEETTLLHLKQQGDAIGNLEFFNNEVEQYRSFSGAPGRLGETMRKAVDFAKALETAKVGTGTDEGNLYTVELLPDESEFLDWDKPLSEQSDKVKVAFGRLYQANKSAFDYYDKTQSSKFSDGTIYGSALYARISMRDMPAGNDAQASKILASMGVKGIRYLDAGSRSGFQAVESPMRKGTWLVQNRDSGQTVSSHDSKEKAEKAAQSQGSYNYVIFDESLVRILEENGKPVEQPKPSYSTANEARLSELYQNLTPELPNPAVREAYDRLATTQTQVAISDLRNESGLSKEDFAQSLQTLFDNGQAVLSPASSIEQQEADAAEYGVFGHGGTPASFVTVMPETNPQYESRTPIILKAGASTSVGGVGMASISPSDNSARAQAIREGISKTNWNELSTAQRAQALEEFGLKSISSRYFFDAAILPVRVTNERTGENRPASVYVAEPSPAITIQFDASGLSNLLSGDAVTAFTAVYDAVQDLNPSPRLPRFSLNSAQEESENESAQKAEEKIKSIGKTISDIQAKANKVPWQGREIPEDVALANHPQVNKDVQGKLQAVARDIVEAQIRAGIPYEEMANEVTKPSFIGRVTKGNQFLAEPMRQFLLMEVGLAIQLEAKNLAKDGKRLDADILLSLYRDVIQAKENKASFASAMLNTQKFIINDEEYSSIYIGNNIETLQAEERRKTVGTNAPGLADEVKAVDAAKDQAAKDVADAVEDIQERSDEEFAMEVMDDEAKSIWQMMKDEIAYIGELARSLVEAGVKGFKASKAASSPVRDSIKNMTVEQRMDEIRKAQTRFKKLGKRLEEVMSKKADEPKRKRVKKVIDTALSNEGLEQTEDGELKATKPRKPRKRQDLFSATEEEQIRIIQRKLNDLRPEEGGIKIPWDKLAQIRISEQKTLESQMFETLKADPAFAGLPDSDLAKLSKIVSKVWQKKRETVIAKELERIEARNDWSKKAKTAVKEHHPKIMRLINAGLFDDNALYALIAEEYGFKELTPEQQARAIAITEKFMDPKTPRYVRAALQKEFKDIMMEVRGPTLLQTLNAVWYSSVLSSMRTMTTIALSVLNNGLTFIGEAVATVIANPTNPSKWVPILDSIDAIAKNLGPAAVDMWKYLKTGDSVYLDSNILNDPFYADQIKKGVALDGVDVGERMYRTAKNPVTKAIGWHVMVITRLLRVLDGFNARLGKVSSMPFMYRRLTDEYDSSVVRALTDPAHYREKLIQDGVDPNSPALSALAMHAMHEDWDSQKGLLSNLEQNTNYNAAWSAMTSDPKGAGGILYGSVKMIERFMGTVADTFEKVIDQRLEMMGKQGVEKDPLEDFIVRRLGKPSSYFLNYLASNLLPGFGLGFVRVVGNSLNQAISLIPFVGMLRVMESQDPRQKVAHRALLMRNQAFGIIGLMVMVKALKDIEDEPDDEKRGWFVEGNWEGLTPQQKAALFASGAQPNSIGYYKNGKRINIRYSEWPLASIFSLTGNLSDNSKYRPESWQTASVASKSLKAAYYMWSSAFTMPAISQAMENLGAPRGSEDPFEAAERRIPKALASFAGGYIPRSIKDLDMWMQSETNRYKGWESLAKEIPFVRRAVGTEYLDVFGKQLETDRAPWSRVFTEGPDDPAYQLLGRLSAKGVWLSPPNPNGKLVGEGSKRREMTPDEGVMYQKEVGKGYRQLVLRYGSRLLQMPEERAKKFASQKAEEVREKVTAKIDRIVR